ncbi:cupin domain-containing protein [Sodalis ligni]|uniref:cupin domain-containing protein n=1 Tax=Sodalis ligni TaxID=2697027 RepID=UPI00193F2121|nr:cupin domain-containing protein [Sodalis ligni]QWA10480.1 cupin domain-containing protein [Sodalis ligni]
MRPEFIKHWSELEAKDAKSYEDSDEPMCIEAPLGRALGLTRIGINHERLLPGHRTSYPHAESAEEEFIYVLEGSPHAWINGYLHQLSPGDAVGLPAGTGICHTFINNSANEVRLLVVGEASKAENRIHYPKNPHYELTREDRWISPPEQAFGGHDGLPDVRPGDEGSLPASR